jgi:hypothetical protein
MKELIVEIEGVEKALRMKIDPTLNGWYTDADKKYVINPDETTCQSYPLPNYCDYGVILYEFEVVGITFLKEVTGSA